jgi:hypothetical protein
MNSLDELIKAFDLIDKPKPLELEYRVYYNDAGDITMCCMTQHPESGNYVVVTRVEYDNFFEYCVRDGKLRHIDRSPKYKKLAHGGEQYKVAKKHAAIILEEDEDFEHEFYSDIKYD